MQDATAIISIAEEPRVAHVRLHDAHGTQVDTRPVFAPLNDSDIAAAINEMISVAIFRGHRSIVITWADAAEVVQ